LEESIELAELMPEIYSAYDKYKNNDVEEVLINDGFASK